MKYIREILPYLLIILVVVTIRTFIITPVIVSGASMQPTLEGNEIMLLKKYDTSYERFDIVVINKSVEGDNLIKRIIGLPNETIEYKHKHLYIDGQKMDDIYAFGDTGEFESITLGNDEYFLMGDNRAISLDSRVIGVIKKDEIEGTVGPIIWPLKKIGNVQ